jgi:putative transcriptional regulator
MTGSNPQFLAGRLLLAMPGMGDSRFDRAVIAMCKHDRNGAFGIGIGEVRQGVRLHGLLDELGIARGDLPDCAIHQGGPVEPGRGFVLHTDDWGGDGTVAVTPLGALSGSQDVLRAIADGRGPGKWLIALGYAGWAAGQLDAEMRRHGWYAARGRPEILFDTPVTARWAASWRAEGIDPGHLSNVTGRA